MHKTIREIEADAADRAAVREHSIEDCRLADKRFAAAQRARRAKIDLAIRRSRARARIHG